MIATSTRLSFARQYSPSKWTRGFLRGTVHWERRQLGKLSLAETCSYYTAILSGHPICRCIMIIDARDPTGKIICVISHGSATALASVARPILRSYGKPYTLTTYKSETRERSKRDLPQLIKSSRSWKGKNTISTGQTVAAVRMRDI